MSSAGPTKGNYKSNSQWAEKKYMAALIRIVVSLTPTAASFLITHYLSRSFPPHRLGLPVPLWWVLLISIGIVVLVLTDRAMRVFLPLVALFKMSLVFPDKAPSRFRLAMKTATTKSLERQVAEVRANGLPDDSTKQAEILLQMVATLNTHDRQTRGHCERVKAYTDMIADEMGLSESDKSKLRWAALAHDVGKLVVPPEILNKEGRPDEAEWKILQSHAWEGSKIAEPLRPWLGDWVEAIGSHHERWDGEGYPLAKAGDEIHLGARIVAVADTFDVITSKRSYQEAIQASKARAEIARCAGAQFDPRVVRAFLNVGIGRLKFAIGPLSWLANLPSAGQASIAPIASPAVTAAVAMAATAAAVATNNLGILISQDSAPETIAFSDEEEIVAPSSTLPESFPLPELSDVTMTVDEDESVAKAILFTTSAGTVAVSVASPPANGRVEFRSSSFEASSGQSSRGAFVLDYTPDPNEAGTDSFSYQICDESEDCVEAIASVTINPVNDPPTISLMADIAAGPGATVVLTPQASDIDGDTLSFRVSGLPSGLTYSSSTGEISGRVGATVRSGRYPIIVTVADRTSSGLTASTEFDLVVPRPDDPIALGVPLATAEDTSIDINLFGIAHTETSTFSIVTPSEHGQLGPMGPVVATSVGSADRSASIRYTPDPNYHGLDSFAFQVCNRDQVCSQATMRLTVTPTNDPPTIVSIPNENYLIGDHVSIPLSIDDVDGPGLEVTTVNLPPGLSYNQVSRAIEGPLTTGGTSWVASVSVSDLGEPPRTASTTFSITVGLIGPEASPGSFALLEDTPSTHKVTAATETGELVFSIPPGQDLDGVAEFLAPRSTGEIWGARSLASNTLTYTPAANSNAGESITYQVCDDDGHCSTSTIDVSIIPVNDAPLLGSLSLEIDEDGQLEIHDEDVISLAQDPEGNPMELVWLIPPDGTVTDQADHAHFNPLADYNGPGVVEYTLCDSLNACTTGSVAINVMPINDAPTIAVPGPQTVHLGETIDLEVTGADVDGDDITFVAYGLPDGLSINPTTGHITGDIATDLGQETVATTIKAYDNLTYTAATLVFTVEAEIRDLTSLGMSTNEDTSSTGFFEGITTAGTVIFAQDDGPDHGTITNLTATGGGGVPFVTSAFFGSFDYTPDPNYHGSDFVTIEITDQATGAIRAHLLVPITVTPVNDAPTINPIPDQSFVLGSPVLVPVTAADVDGDNLTFSATNMPLGLTIDETTGLISGTIPANVVRSGYNAIVKVDDGTTSTQTGFRITLTQPAPGADDVIVQEDTVTTVYLFVQTNYSADITVTSSPAHGTITNLPLSVGDGGHSIQVFPLSFDYTPDSNRFGTDSLTLRACNTVVSNDCADYQVDFFIESVNDAPVVAAHPAISITDGQPVAVSVSASDIDGDDLTYTAFGLPEGLTIDPVTGVISGTYAQPGTATDYTTIIKATDNGSPSERGTRVFIFLVS